MEEVGVNGVNGVRRKKRGNPRKVMGGDERVKGQSKEF